MMNHVIGDSLTIYHVNKTMLLSLANVFMAPLVELKMRELLPNALFFSDLESIPLDLFFYLSTVRSFE